MVDVTKYNRTKVQANTIQDENVTWDDGYVQCTYSIHYSVYFYVTMLEMYELLKYENNFP